MWPTCSFFFGWYSVILVKLFRSLLIKYLCLWSCLCARVIEFLNLWFFLTLCCFWYFFYNASSIFLSSLDMVVHFMTMMFRHMNYGSVYEISTQILSSCLSWIEIQLGFFHIEWILILTCNWTDSDQFKIPNLGLIPSFSVFSPNQFKGQFQFMQLWLLIFCFFHFVFWYFG